MNRSKIFIAAVLSFGVAALFFTFLVKPKMTEIGDVRTEVEAARDEQATLESQLARLETLKKQAPELAARLQRVATFLPSTPDLPNFIRLIQSAATQSGVDLKSIAPNPPVEMSGRKGVFQIEVTLVVEAGFYRIEDFLARVENLRRILVVKTIGMTPRTDELSGRTVLQATMSMKMFVVSPDSKTAAAGQASPSPSATPTSSPVSSP